MQLSGGVTVEKSQWRQHVQICSRRRTFCNQWTFRIDVTARKRLEFARGALRRIGGVDEGAEVGLVDEQAAHIAICMKSIRRARFTIPDNLQGLQTPAVLHRAVCTLCECVFCRCSRGSNHRAMLSKSIDDHASQDIVVYQRSRIDGIENAE